MAQLINLNQLDFLTKIGCEEETVDILGTKFSFRTLTVEETTDSFEAPSKDKLEDGVAKLNSLRIEVLARAIVKINDLIIPDNFRERVKEKLRRMQQIAIAKLFDSYQNLVKRQEDKFKLAESELDNQVPATTIPIGLSVAQQSQPMQQQSPQMVPTPPPAPPPPVEVSSSEEPVSIVNPQSLIGPRK